MKQTKVSKALAFLQANPGATAYAAAKHAKCSPATVYAKLNADRSKLAGVCPECGQKLGATKPHEVSSAEEYPT